MTATQTISIAHGLTDANIRMVDAYIRADTGALILCRALNVGGAAYIDTNYAGYVRLTRDTAGAYDSVGYNDPAADRGWVSVWYV